MKVSQIRSNSRVNPFEPINQSNLEDRVKAARIELAQVEADGEFLPNPPRTEEEYDIVDDYHVRLRAAKRKLAAAKEQLLGLDHVEDELEQREKKAKQQLTKLRTTQHMEATTNHMGETEIHTYAGWKRALKKMYPDVKFVGDRDIDNAFSGGRGVGEWDGEVGLIFNDNRSKRPLIEGAAENNREYQLTVKQIDSLIADLHDRLIDHRVEFESHQDDDKLVKQLKTVAANLRAVVNSVQLPENSR